MALIFRQLFESESSTYTYILGDSVTKKAVIIDSVIETIDRDQQILKELGLELEATLETHIHADHITASGLLKKNTGAKIVAGAATELSTADLLLADGDQFSFGEQVLTAIATPGHTLGCTSYLVGDRVFTGDALMIRGCGRTDFQGGSSSVLFHSVRSQLFRLPGSTYVYPGHDYNGRTVSTINEEKQFNPRLNLKLEEDDFVKIMDDLKLAPPKKIDTAVPANLKSGLL